MANLENLEFGVTEPINFKNFFLQWQEEIGPKDPATSYSDTDFMLHLKEYEVPKFEKTNFIEFAAVEMANGDKITNDVIEELDAECSPETLNCDTEPKDIDIMLSSIPDDIELTSVQYQRQELDQRKRHAAYRKKGLLKMKYRARDAPWKHLTVTADRSAMGADDAVRAAYPDILVNVQVYRPYMKRRNLVLELEFNVLGQQKLTELRDRIVCMSDYMAVGDFSSNPDQPRDVLAKDLYKSGFFFVEGVFYNDMRDPSSIDISRNIIEWSKDPSRGVGPYYSQLMETTCFIDLTARLGQPYVYMHQGDCEHIIIFSDLRMMHPDDCIFLDQYPLLVFKSRERKPKCRVCQLYLARWVTSGSCLAPEDPCFFCDTCFRALHYDNTGKKLSPEMKVYPYPDIRPLKK